MRTREPIAADVLSTLGENTHTNALGFSISALVAEDYRLREYAVTPYNASVDYDAVMLGLSHLGWPIDRIASYFRATHDEVVSAVERALDRR